MPWTCAGHEHLIPSGERRKLLAAYGASLCERASDRCGARRSSLCERDALLDPKHEARPAA